MHAKFGILIFLALAANLISGCSWDPVWDIEPTHLDRQLGATANLMLAQQIDNPQAALHPPEEPPENLDGAQGEQVIRNYRTPTSNNQQRNRMTSFSIFQQLGGLNGNGGGNGSSGGGGTGR